MTLLVVVSVLMHLGVLLRCAQLFALPHAVRDTDKNMVIAFGAGSVFSLALTVAHVLYAEQLKDILGLWSGFMIYNATIHLAIITLMVKKIPRSRRNRRHNHAVG